MLRILERCDLRISRRAALDPSGYLGLAKRLPGEIPGDEGFRKLGNEWNRVVDFAVLLEPVYWLHIVNALEWPSHPSEPDVWRAYEAFRTKALEFTKMVRNSPTADYSGRLTSIVLNLEV